MLRRILCIFFASVDGSKIALLAVDDFRAVRSIRRFHLCRALRALPRPEFSRVSQCQPLPVPLIRTLARDRYAHLPVELQFLRNDFERFSGFLACQDLSADGIIGCADALGDLHLRPEVIPSLLILMPCKSASRDFFP